MLNSLSLKICLSLVIHCAHKNFLAKWDNARSVKYQHVYFSWFVGVFTLPVSTLRDPPPYLKVREVKLWYVDYLAKMLVEEDSDHEDLTAPLLVVASVSQSDFRQKNMNSYTYEV